MSSADFAFEFDQELVEEAVLRAPLSNERRCALARERERLYTITDAGQRDAAFAAAAANLFREIELDAPLIAALRTCARVARVVARAIVRRVTSPRAEGAELFVAPTGNEPPVKTLVVRLRVETLLDPTALSLLLSRDLQCIDDMLDPEFGYDPSWPGSEVEGAWRQLVVDRYSAAWDATVAGRNARRGRTPPSELERSLRRFLEAFPMLGERARESFELLAADEAPTHQRLAYFAMHPPAAGPHISGAILCTVCNLPTFDAVTTESALPAGAGATLHSLVPSWVPGKPVCRQCLDWSHSARLSMAEAQRLPGLHHQHVRRST